MGGFGQDLEDAVRPFAAPIATAVGGPAAGLAVGIAQNAMGAQNAPSPAQMGMQLAGYAFPNSDLGEFINSTIGQAVISAYGGLAEGKLSTDDFDNLLESLGLMNAKDLIEDIAGIVILAGISDEYAEDAYNRLKETEATQLQTINDLRNRAAAMYPTEEEFKASVATNLQRVDQEYKRAAEGITRQATARGMGEQMAPQVARIMGHERVLTRLQSRRQAELDRQAQERYAFQAQSTIPSLYEPIRRAQEEEYYTRLGTIPSLAEALMQRHDPNDRAYRDYLTTQTEATRAQMDAGAATPGAPAPSGIGTYDPNVTLGDYGDRPGDTVSPDYYEDYATGGVDTTSPNPGYIPPSTTSPVRPGYPGVPAPSIETGSTYPGIPAPTTYAPRTAASATPAKKKPYQPDYTRRRA